jgi:hypothetical protein
VFSPRQAPSVISRNGKVRGAVMVVCSAVGLWLRGLPPWDTMLGGVGVVLALRFSAYGEARKSLLREARGLSPC